MKITLLENQIDLILDSLKAYTKESDRKQLIYATYESLLAQKIDNKIPIKNEFCYKNVIKM